jgi:ABC-type sugar transport system ATPase subunit
VNAEGAGPAAEVALRGLTKRFGDVVALHPLDLDIAAGELVVLVGASGCGKSTVLRLVAGLETPSGGTIVIGGRSMADVEPPDRDVAMVFQNYALYPHKTVRENLGFGLRMRRRPAAEIARKVAWAADVLSLGTLLDRYPSQLSGGQKQRVAFGRAMVREPRVFLFDEPLSNLDARLRADMRQEIAELHARLGTTTIYVTHDQAEAMTLGQRLAVLREGRLQQVASPLDIYRRPANLDVARFIGTPAINLAGGRLEGLEPLCLVAGRLRLRFDGAPSPEALVVGVRAEDLRLVAPDDSGLDLVTRVRRIEQLGNESLVQVDGPAGDAWTIRASADCSVGPGDAVGLVLDRSRVLLFNADTGARLDAGRLAESEP